MDLVTKLISVIVAIAGAACTGPAFKRTGGPVTEAEALELLQAVEAVRNDGRRMMAGIAWTMTVMPKLGGKLDPERLTIFMKRARDHYGNCVRQLPADWPKTPLPPLPPGPPAGVEGLMGIGTEA